MGLIAVCLVTAAVTAFVNLTGDCRWWVVGPCLVALFLLWLLRRAVVKPLDAVETGFDMLRAQDFGSRLRCVGERHADRVADLFNDMAGQLKRERLRLLEQESFLRQLVEVSPMGVVVMDYDWRVTLVNPAFLHMADLDCVSEELEGKAFGSLGGELISAALEVPQGDSRTVRLSDTQVYKVSNLWFMDMGFRRPFILVESLTDEVMQVERRGYEKVIRVMSHEVNNTLGGVASIMETMADICDDDELRQVIESGEDRCRALADFIRSYADVVKLAEPVMVPVDLAAEARRLAPFLRTVCGEDVELRLDVCPCTVEAKADPVMFEQVLVNVVKNAAESVRSCASTGGYVELSVSKDERGCGVVEVTDNGIGISEETARKLFTPFFSTKSNGRGIGLTLVHEILSRHGARYTLRTGSDRLTRFRIRL